MSAGGDNAIERTQRSVIEKKLLVRLQDRDTVAILCSEKDISMLIYALHTSPLQSPEHQAYQKDLEQLRREAFGK